MTTNLMLSHPEVFKVGVAGGPVLDWKYYEAMYGERYMETPQSNPEGYAEASMVEHAAKLKGRLQIIVGSTTPPACSSTPSPSSAPARCRHTARLLRLSRTRPPTWPVAIMIHLHERITRYFEDHLKPLRK